ncbi:MAG TPA: hydantoinase/oxoprolinase family protein [Pirellulales bacterium]|nr:hydantoinase/oxoprolinase family protein [Pirellulales bacterium]
MTNDLLAFDIGGANLKLADGRGFAASIFFPLWQRPSELADILAALVATAPAAERFAVTMTGELADCFATKAEGVSHILAAVAKVAAPREVRVYLTDGSLVTPADAIERPLMAAASNWHVLACFSGRYAPRGAAILLDIGSTTCDLVPLENGRPVARGRTDPERLMSGELVYTGVVRSPVCAVAASLPWHGAQVPIAHELFATTWDAYLTLGELPEEPECTQTADGRPATKAAARDRLARMICADREMFDDDDALAAAAAVARAQLAKIAVAAQAVVRRMTSPPAAVVACGQGEFLAPRLLEKLKLGATLVSLGKELGTELSRVATAHALAVIAREAASPGRDQIEM